MVLIISIHTYIHTQRCRDEMRLQDLDPCFVVYVGMYLLVCVSVVRGLVLTYVDAVFCDGVTYAPFVFVAIVLALCLVDLLCLPC